MNNLQIIQQAAETAFQNGLLKDQLLQREEIIKKLQETISANITKLEEKRIAVARAKEELNNTIEDKDRRISQLEENLNNTIEAHDTLVETRTQLHKTIVEKKERISELETILKQVNDKYEGLVIHHNQKIDALQGDCNVKDEKIRGLNSQLHLVENSKNELTKQTEETIILLKANNDDQRKRIEENEGQFKILNDTIKKHMTEIDRIKRKHTKEIENMEKEFQTQLQKQSAKFLDQVKKSNSQNDKKAKTANLHTTNLENEVGLQ